MYDKAVHYCLLVLNFAPDWFVTIEMIEQLEN